MKKAIIVSLLISVFTGGAFAQLTFSGEVFAGIRLQSDDDERSRFDTYHREDNFSRAPRFDFTATVLRENYGARLDTSFEMPSDGGELTLNGIYAWVDFYGFLGNDLLRLTMGQISSTPWVLPRFHPSHSEIKFGDIRGFRVEYTTPIHGLSIGAAFRTDGQDFESFGKEMIIGATYIHPMFNTVIAYDLSENAHLLFGFSFLGIPDLTVGFQLLAERLASWDDPVYGFPGILQTRYKVGYRVIRPLNVFLIFSQRFHGESGVGPYWEITPGLEYRFLPNLTGTLSVSLDNYGGSPDNNLTIRTGIEHTLRGPAFLYAEYELRLDKMDTATHTFGFGITIRAF